MKTCTAVGCKEQVRDNAKWCPKCRLQVRAARARKRRGGSPLPPMPGGQVQGLLEALEEVRDALDRLMREREKAEVGRGLDAMPFAEVDLWLRSAQASLYDARKLAASWAHLARVQASLEPGGG